MFSLQIWENLSVSHEGETFNCIFGLPRIQVADFQPPPKRKTAVGRLPEATKKAPHMRGRPIIRFKKKQSETAKNA